MQRRWFIAGLAGAIASPLVAGAADRSGPFRVAYIAGSSLVGSADLLAAFRRQLKELGYIEGESLAIDARGADGHFDRLPQLFQEAIALKPDVICAVTTPGALAAKRATTRIPIVFAGVADPLGVGLVDNLARPHGNITGVTNISAELTGKRLQLLQEIVPGLKHVAVLVNPDDPNAKFQMRFAESAAGEMRVGLGPILPVRTAGDPSRAIAAAASAGADAAIRFVDPTISQLRKETIAAAAQYRVPVIYPFREAVAAGGLISYGTDLPAQFAQAATLVAKILRGATPQDLPVEQAARFELLVNAKTAKALGLVLPPSLLATADEVLE
jgi:putative ABC transport system substrate-binding protein